MITFKQFLEEARRPERTQPASVEDIIAFADKYASNYLKGKHFLFRGGSGRGAPLMLGNSVSSHPRRSANTNNNYTMWMDNHPKFEGYPLRSQSFIGTDQKHTASGFGGVSILIVSDSAKVGIVGNDDLWYVNVYGTTTIEEFNPQQEDILEMFDRGNNETYADLVSALKYATAVRIEEKIEDGPGVPKWQEDRLREVLKVMNDKDCDNLYELWDKCFTPDLFPKPRSGADASKEPYFGEVWIQGSVAFISARELSVDEDDREALREWAEKYPNFAEFLEEHWGDHDFDE